MWSTFAEKLEAHVKAGGCDCQDHLRAAGLTPPRSRLGEFPLSRAFPPGHGPRSRQEDS